MLNKIRVGRGLWLVSTVFFSLICAIVRRWQLSSAFEEELGLAIPHAPATVILTCLLAMAVAVLLILAVKQKVAATPRGAQHKLWRHSGMVAPNDTVTLTGTVAAAFLSLAAAPVLLWQGWRLRQEHSMAIVMGMETGGNNGVLLMLTAVTSLLGFFGLLMAGRDRYRGIREGKGERLLMLPSVNGCLWLMESYRGHAANPVLWDYVPLLLAIICGMLFYMDCAGLAADAIHPRRTLWLSGMTVVLSAVALASDWDLGSAMLLVSQILAALTVLWRLPMNMEHPPVVEVPQVVEEEIQEEDQDV